MEHALRYAIMILGLYGPDSPHYRRAQRLVRRTAWLLVAEADDHDHYEVSCSAGQGGQGKGTMTEPIRQALGAYCDQVAVA